MKLTSLSAPEERGRDPYVQTPDGRIIDLMPELLKAGYIPAGIATIIGRRQDPRQEVRTSWGTYFFTGDSSATNNTGEALFTLDAELLRELNPQSPLVNGALALDAETAQAKWRELKADKKNSLYLSPAQVDEAHEKGYIIDKNGKFVPANKTVGKIFEGSRDFPGLAHGQNVRTYAQQVSEASNGNKEVLKVYFDLSKPENPQWRSLVLYSIGYLSYVLGPSLLFNLSGRLAGVSAGAFRQESHERSDSSASVNVARSADVSEPSLRSDKSGKKVLVSPTLDEVLAIVNNPNLDRVRMAKALSEFYNQ